MSYYNVAGEKKTKKQTAPQELMIMISLHLGNSQFVKFNPIKLNQIQLN